MNKRKHQNKGIFLRGIRSSVPWILTFCFRQMCLSFPLLFVGLCPVTQSRHTLCDPLDCSPPGSSIHEVFPERTLERLPFLPPGYLPHPGIEPTSSSPVSPALAGRFFITVPPIALTWKCLWLVYNCFDTAGDLEVYIWSSKICHIVDWLFWNNIFSQAVRSFSSSNNRSHLLSSTIFHVH